MSLSTWWKNRKLKADRRALDKVGNRLFKKARKEHDQTELDNWYDANRWQYNLIEASIKENDSRELLDLAESLYLPTPASSDKEKWVDAEDLLPGSGQHWSVLTPEAMTELRTAIRKEERERREVVESWLKIFGALIVPLTGLIGTIIGLVAVWTKK